MSESLSVLLVEDDPIQRSLAHRILSLEARLSGEGMRLLAGGVDVKMIEV